MLALTFLLTMVVIGLLALRYGADTRPGPADPPQPWIGRR